MHADDSTLLREQLGDAFSQAIACPGDQRALTDEIEIHRNTDASSFAD